MCHWNWGSYQRLLWCLAWWLLYEHGVLEVELWALYHGIVLACHKEWFPLDIESDSQIAVQMLSSELEEEHPYYSLVTSCKKMLRSKDCSISHKYTEGNCLVDKLAVLSSKRELGCSFWEGVPEGFGHYLLEDLSGVARPRSLFM